MHFVRRHSEVFTESSTRLVHPLTRFGGRWIDIIRLYLQSSVIRAQARDDRSAGVRATGILKEGLPSQGGLGTTLIIICGASRRKMRHPRGGNLG